MAAKQGDGIGGVIDPNTVAQVPPGNLQQPQRTTITAPPDLAANNPSTANQIPPTEAHNLEQDIGTQQNSLSFTRLELAYKELQDTLEQAQKYREAGQLHKQHIRLHIDALREDADNLATQRPDDEENSVTIAELLMAARRTRRQLERDVIDLEIEENNKPSSTVSESSSARSKTSALKFAPIQMPIFDGNPTQFPTYRNFFEENVLNNIDITETAKWLRLKESLKGQPAELLSEIPQSGEALQIAWKLLKDTYGGDERPVVELYARLQALPHASTTTDRLRVTHGRLEGLIMSLEHLGQDVDANHFIRWTYMGKFPAEIVYQIRDSKTMPFKDVRRAIGNIISARECTDQQRAVAATKPEPARRTLQQLQRADAPVATAPTRKLAAPSRALRCAFCEGAHWNDECTVYPDVATRTKKLQGKCLRCLRNAHNTPCVGGERRCYHCDSLSHNRALCPTKFGQAPGQPQLAILPQQSEQPENQSTAGHFLTFVAEAKSQFVNEAIPIRILVDTAGGKSLLTERAARKLQIPVNKEQTMQYTGLDDVPLTTSDALQGDVHLLTPDGKTVQIRAAMLHGTIPQVPTANVEQFRRTHPQYNQLYMPTTGEGQPIDLLIGNDAVIDIIKPEKINAIDADTLLLPTHFGYLIVGRRRQHYSKVCPSMLFKFNVNPLQYLSDVDLVGFTGFQQSDIEEEEKAIRQFYETVRFVDNRYSISWPWRSYPPQLDTNFGLAIGKLKSLQRRLLKTPDLLKNYNEIIHNQLREGIIEIVDTSRPANAIIHYLPHHPILQPEKSTSVRPVIDASSKTSIKSKSLNDNIRKGTKWINDLLITLLRFRKTEKVVVADVARAFHQISINESDRDAARFLWLKNPEAAPTMDNLLTLRFTRVAFGIIASPFLLHAVIRHHANQQKENSFLDIILSDMYADNLVAGLEENIHPQQFYTYAKQFFSSMSMNLTKWATNIPELHTTIPDEDKQPGNVQSVLGLKWDIQKDALRLKKPKTYFNTEVTPRVVAQKMASHFDPLGWGAPVILQAKIYFRTAWEQTKKWDVAIQQNSSHEWQEIEQELSKIEQIELPRKASSIQHPQRRQLHTFVDASMEAYAVVVYMRTIGEQETETNIIMAKARLTPKKKITIPKLELIAILLGCRLTSFVKTSMQFQEDIETFIWSDSKCAIAWMNQNKILPPVIEKQINEAKKFSINNIRYVPSDQNYADVASRGASIETLKNLNWWIGPKWLQNENTWPQQVSEEQPETNTYLLYQTAITQKLKIIEEDEIPGVADIKIRDYSSLVVLLRRTAYVFRALMKIFKKNFLDLRSEIDVNVALQYWIHWDQKRMYALESEPEAGKKFVLRNITVFRDTNKIIRCNTRITNSCLNLETVNPILLVKKSTLSKLIILDAHERVLHAGTSHTLAQLRKKYWLPQGRREVFNVIHNDCFLCRKQTQLPYPTPPPAPLPEFRVTKTNSPFQAIGLDVCGPFYTRKILGTRQPKEKRWIILFTCAVIRAIHLEVLQDMSTEEILLAFRKFVARRGVPTIIVSDNAPQFHLLDGCFKDLWKETARAKTISKYLAEQKIAWTFIPEQAPWMGGMYERLIQSVKIAFQRTYGDVIMLDRQFEASIIEIEGVLNSRPISYVDREPDSPILTPNDFLAARYISIPIDSTVKQTDIDISRMWKESQNYLNKYWKDWAEHYLLILRERNDRLKIGKRNARQIPEKGDIVVMVDHSKKRSAWQTAVVERRIPGKDGQIRALQIRLPEGVRLIRPTIMLAPLKLKVDLPKIHDQQLAKDRRTIIVWPPEGATQLSRIPEQRDEEEQRGDTVKGRRGSEGDGARSSPERVGKQAGAVAVELVSPADQVARPRTPLPGVSRMDRGVPASNDRERSG